jgi:glycerol-3-phosphate acyltransferase PlsY
MIEGLLILAAYVIGSIPTGVIVGRLRGFDPRAVGSGNIGTSNVIRAGGMSAAAMTFAGDVLKCAIPVIIARAAGFPAATIAWVGLAAFIGAICSVFLFFQGGKGIAAALGVWLAISPMAILFALIVFAVVLAISRIMSLASICAAIALPPTVAALGLPHHYLLLAILMTALALYRHRENIKRLSRGEEPKFSPRRSGSTAS